VKDFDLGDVLSITTGRLVSRRHIDGVYDILNYMTGDSLFTHQLPRAQDECRPWLLRQHPDLAEVDADGVNAETWRGWLDAQVARYGATRPVAPIPADDHARRDPIQEAIEMVGPERVIAIDPEATP
jgi:hypothetical protein